MGQEFSAPLCQICRFQRVRGLNAMGAAVFVVTITKGKSDWGRDIEVGVLMTDDIELGTHLRDLLHADPAGYRVKIKQLPTHVEDSK